jgi:16S rRNA (guanine966-N2)-methyltransferase
LKESIQIIGGKYRGKKISFPRVDNLRPTPNRIKETLFNWLMHDIRNARCLDAFAGSGSLGIEAFSRGAANITFIEKDKNAFNNLKKICESFQSPDISVINADTSQYLNKQSQNDITTFDIIFMDPPFTKEFPTDCISYLSNTNILATNGLLYIEYGQEIDLDSTIWKRLKQKQAGQVVYALYKKISFP